MNGRPDARITRAVPLLVFLVVLAVDVPMIAAGVAIGDAAEAQTIPAILGIAHPTGFPAYTLAGWFVVHALPVATVAWRLNAFAALCTAASAAAVAAAAIAIGGAWPLATAAALVFAFGAPVWNGALVANAQVLAEPLAIAALGGALAFARTGERRPIAAAALACGAAVATHPSGIFVAPALVFALLWQRERLTRRTLAVVVACFALPLALYAYLPIRSSIVVARGLDPTAAPPLAIRDGFDWNANDPRTLDGFLDEILGRKEGAGGSLARALDPRAIPGALVFWFGLTRAQYGPAVIVLALAGAVALAWRDRRSFTVLLAGTSGGIAFAYQYQTDVHLDRYVVVSFATIALAASAAAQLPFPRAGRLVVMPVVGAVLALAAAGAFATNRPAVGQPASFSGTPIVAAVARDTPADAVVVAQWNDAAALGYGAYVERALDRRLIVSGWPTTYEDRYAAWAAARPVVLFVSRIGLMHGLPMDRRLRLHVVPSSLRGYAVVAVVARRSLVPTAGGAGIEPRWNCSNAPQQRSAAGCDRWIGRCRCAIGTCSSPAVRAGSASNSPASSDRAAHACRSSPAMPKRSIAPAPI